MFNSNVGFNICVINKIGLIFVKWKVIWISIVISLYNVVKMMILKKLVSKFVWIIFLNVYINIIESVSVIV